jgi:phosphoenolpyruvate carboxylase
LTSIPQKENLRLLWIDKKDLPFKLPLNITVFPVPGIGINVQAVRELISSLLAGKKYNKLKNVLSVKECVKKMLSSEIEVGDQIWVSALCSEVIPHKIVYFPSLTSKAPLVQLSVGRGSAAFSYSVGRDFFSGGPCNYIYLADVDWGESYFLRVYFPSTELEQDHLKLINNHGVVIFGTVDETSTNYPCIRTDTENVKTIISKFTKNCNLGIKVQALYVAKKWDTLSYLKRIDLKTSYEEPEMQEKLEIFWLKGTE